MIIEYAEVRNIKDDPTFSGRVQVRCYLSEHDEEKVKDENLKWALPMMPPTSASTHKIGSSPVGLQKGSRVVVTYAESDKAKKYPIILGSFFRGAQPTQDGSAHDEATHKGGTKNPGVDVPHSASPQGGKEYENHVQSNDGLEGGSGAEGGAAGAAGLLSGGLSGALSGGGLSSVVSQLSGGSALNAVTSAVTKIV